MLLLLLDEFSLPKDRSGLPVKKSFCFLLCVLFTNFADFIFVLFMYETPVARRRCEFMAIISTED